jgi:hypothetical protein
VTVVAPPHADGAVGDAGLFVNTPLHPPLAVVVANHAVNFVSIADCVWQAASVTSLAQVNTTAGDAVTVNVFVQLCAAPHDVV